MPKHSDVLNSFSSAMAAQAQRQANAAHKEQQRTAPLVEASKRLLNAMSWPLDMWCFMPYTNDKITVGSIAPAAYARGSDRIVIRLFLDADRSRFDLPIELEKLHDHIFIRCLDHRSKIPASDDAWDQWCSEVSGRLLAAVEKQASQAG